MSVPVIAFFNNKGGVGKTSLVYHVAWMMSELGLRVVAADLDPQCNLSAAFLEEDRLEQVFLSGAEYPPTIHGAVKPLTKGVGDITMPWLERIDDNLALIIGDIALSEFEDMLSQDWPLCLDRKERAFRVISAFSRVLQIGARRMEANVVLMDVGPNLGAINRAAIISADFLVIPLGPDLYSLQGLRNLGPTLGGWWTGWKERLEKNPASGLDLPGWNMHVLGYVVMQHSVYSSRPVKSYDKWIGRIPGHYRKYMFHQEIPEGISVDNDPNCLARIKHYRSLMPMAQEARKPIFHLKPADGALGSHAYAVQDASDDFKRLSRKIAERAGIPIQ
uniref:CobQ/CobB/MinD/ParA nucleotide binding domain-containing protein n=2 Tax=unclassified Candidatus Kentrum TaxID=2643149 RepID=A0A451BHU1_9GAMM|nr:MAG: CobQ/CobB/MinD/ParA nucleotide binding domain-containing protein [Candidatus Kentron sp. LPFa]VFK36511.1 MAG: CobQ/CobB/MinD/ParA nucleotide binding domain-containing protein [Candidatus Kentron sp. SD]VFK77829.1 MAG: CobQ/CobB/MinD/ParA nucleotide binding domain-containing protein [Candidatus Kentron sp. SD]